MSELGQKAKYSRRADVFRFTPESGLKVRHHCMSEKCQFLPKQISSLDGMASTNPAAERIQDGALDGGWSTKIKGD
jgi:hypothetical protein